MATIAQIRAQSQEHYMTDGSYKYPCDMPIQHKRIVDGLEQKYLTPCGKCNRCVKLRRRIWTGRLLAEKQSHKECTFITLTYDPAHEQTDFNYWHIQNFLKKLRKNRERNSSSCLMVGPDFRHFTIGERGDMFGRIHWHMIAFSCQPLGTKAVKLPSWPYGQVFAVPAQGAAINYVAGYCTKKQTAAEPSSPRMSIGPPMGAMWSYKMGQLTQANNVPLSQLESFYRVGNSTYPWDQTMLDWFELGMMDQGAQIEDRNPFSLTSDLRARLYPFWKSTSIENSAAMLISERQRNTSRLLDIRIPTKRLNRPNVE